MSLLVGIIPSVYSFDKQSALFTAAEKRLSEIALLIKK